MLIEWNEEKNIKLTNDWTRGHIGFEEIKEKILKNEIVSIESNPNYENQEIFILDFNGYPVACPFVKTENGYFLKTLYKCRKYKKKLKGEK